MWQKQMCIGITYPLRDCVYVYVYVAHSVQTRLETAGL